jgi:hypothetical protein
MTAMNGGNPDIAETKICPIIMSENAGKARQHMFVVHL